MSRINESPKDGVYAQCDMLGYDTVKEQIDTDSLTWTNSQNKKYVSSWLKREEDRMQQAEHMKTVLELAKQDSKTAKKAVKISWISALIAAISAIVAIAALFIGGA